MLAALDKFCFAAPGTGSTSRDVRRCEFGVLSCPGEHNLTQCPNRGDTLREANLFCACGYQGPMCATCKDDYLRTWSGTPKCARCDQSKVYVPLILLGGCAVFVGTAVACLSKIDRIKTTAQKLYVIGVVKWRYIFFTCQVISSFQSISSETGEKTPFPDPAGTFAAALGVSNLDVFSFISLRCMVPETNFYTVLLVKTVGPFCFIALLFCYPLACCIARRPHRQAWQTSARFSLLCLEIVLPSITTTIVQTLVCDSYDNGSFLRAELSTACDDSLHRKKWVYYAWLMLLAYPAGT